MTNSYKIATLLDIIELDEDQIDRICAELPAVLKYAKNLKDVFQTISGLDKSVAEACKIVSPLNWIDDGKHDLNVTAKCNDDELLTIKISNPISTGD